MTRLAMSVVTLWSAGLSSGQEPSGDTKTPPSLSDHRLAVHAHLPQNNPPGVSLRGYLADARTQAPSKGILTWKGLNFSVTDHEVLSPSATFAESLLQLYARHSCGVDAIVIGHLRSFTYRLSASETGIYGDYLFVIDSVLKDNASSPIPPGAEVVITRPGGSLTLPEGPVTMRFDAYPPLQVNSTYLFFLRYINASSAYRPADSLSTLLLDVNHGWVVTRSMFSNLRLAELRRGALETQITSWSKSCK